MRGVLHPILLSKAEIEYLLSLVKDGSNDEMRKLLIPYLKHHVN